MKFLKATKYLSLILTFVILLSACGKTEETTTMSDTSGEADAMGYEWMLDGVEPAKKKPYTIMMYINGSDLESLEGCASVDIEEMIASKYDEEQVNLVMLTGGTEVWTNESIPVATTVSVLKDGKVENLLDLKEASIIDPAVLTAYIDYATYAFPADKFGFVFWNHGAGTIGGYGMDELSSYASMGIKDLASGFANTAMAEKNEKLEFIGFDCCLMATMEIGQLLSPYANYMIASEEAEPGNGWDYSWLKDLSDDPKMSGEEIGTIICDKFVKFYDVSTEEAGNLSVLDLSAMQEVVDTMGALATAASGAIENGDFATISKARNDTKEFGKAVGTIGDQLISFDLIDITDFAMHLEEDFPKEAAAVIKAVDAAVVYNANTEGMLNAYGLSTYLPYSNKVEADNNVAIYESVITIPGYNEFLQSYTNELNGERLERNEIYFAKPQQYQDEYFVELPPELLKDINDVNFMVWEPITGQEGYYANLYNSSDVVINENGKITTQYDNTLVTLGGKPACFYIVEKFGETARYAIPAVLNDQDVNIMVTVNDRNPSGKILGATVPTPANSSQSPRGMTPIVEGDTLALKYFCPLFVTEKTDMSEYEETEKWKTGEEFIVGKELVLERVPMEYKPYMFSFIVEDIYNNKYSTDLSYLNQ